MEEQEVEKKQWDILKGSAIIAVLAVAACLAGFVFGW